MTSVSTSFASGTPLANSQRQSLYEMVADFTRAEIEPDLAQWEEAGLIPRDLHLRAGELGLMGLSYEPEIGGSGGDLADVVAMTEAILTNGGSGGLVAGLFTHGIALPHVVDEVRRRQQADDPSAAALIPWVAGTLAGELIGALGVTEPDGGSDVAALRTTAIALDHMGQQCAVDQAASWRLHGTKTYITSASRADYVVVAARAYGAGAAGIALFLVPTDTTGFSIVRTLDKMGWRCSDTAELALVDVEVPAAYLLTNGAGGGFASLATHFAVERISLAVTAYATGFRCLDLTLQWAQQRTTFGRPLQTRQVIRHDLVEMYRQLAVARTYTHALVSELISQPDHGTPPANVLLRAVLAKNTAVAACDFAVERAVQIQGGYGYLKDAEVERHYRDAKILGIGGGATEVMTDLASRLLGI